MCHGRLYRHPEFSTNGKAPVYGGDSACPPKPPLCFVSIILLRRYRSMGCHSGGGGGITCRYPKKNVKKKYFEIFP